MAGLGLELREPLLHGHQLRLGRLALTFVEERLPLDLEHLNPLGVVLFCRSVTVSKLPASLTTKLDFLLSQHEAEMCRNTSDFKILCCYLT